MSNGKDMIIVLIAGSIKNIWCNNIVKKSINTFLNHLIQNFGESIKYKLDLSNYATKTDLKNVTHVDTSSLALKTNLANLKTEFDKLDIGKLVSFPADLSKLSDVVKNDVVKKRV